MRRTTVMLIILVAGAAVAATRLRPSPTVTTVVVAPGNLIDAISATGVVEARSVRLAATVPGRVASVLVREGDRVRVGQLLVVLDGREPAALVDQARAALAAVKAQEAQAAAALRLERAEVRGRILQAEGAVRAARAQRDKVRAGPLPAEIAAVQAEVVRARTAAAEAARNRDRVRSLVLDGALGRAELDAVVGVEEAARASLEAAQAQLARVREGARAEDVTSMEAVATQAEAALQTAREAQRGIEVREAQLDAATAQVRHAEAALRAALAQLDGTRITAPFAGTVVDLEVEPGQVAAPGAPLLALADLSAQWVSIRAESDDLARFEAAASLDVTSESYPGRVFAGQLSGIASVATSSEAGKEWAVRVKVAIDDPALLLRPGMEVDVDGRVTLARGVLRVPKEAIFEQDERAYAFVWSATAVRRVEVTTGPATLAEVAVLSGLRAGDVVVTSGLEHVRRGHRVRVAAGR